MLELLFFGLSEWIHRSSFLSPPTWFLGLRVWKRRRTERRSKGLRLIQARLNDARLFTYFVYGHTVESKSDP
jgi:hypothetical protein